MRIAKKSWGQVTIKQAGVNKRFDRSKSFAIEETKNKLTLEQISELFKLVIILSEHKSYQVIKKALSNER